MDALGAGFSAGLRTDFCSVACRGYRLSISRARLPPPAGPGVRRVAVQVRGLTPFACGRCCFTLTGRVGAAPTPVCARQRERERDEGSGGHTKVGAGSLRAQEVSPPSGSREALPEALPNTSPRFVRGLLPSRPGGLAPCLRPAPSVLAGPLPRPGAGPPGRRRRDPAAPRARGRRSAFSVEDAEGRGASRGERNLNTWARPHLRSDDGFSGGSRPPRSARGGCGITGPQSPATPGPSQWKGRSAPASAACERRG